MIPAHGLSPRPNALRTQRLGVMGGRVARGGFVLLALLAACSRADDQPGQITADDQRQLNEAAAMLDANSVDANRVGTGNESER